MRGRDLLTVAVKLRDMQSEAAERSRIGRAYYAAFLESRVFIGSFLHVRHDRSSGTHQTVPAALGRVVPELAEALTQLRSMRNAADYDLDLPDIDFTSRADQACALAARIILGIDRLSTAHLNREPTSPLLLIDHLPNESNHFDAVTFYLLSYPALVPTFRQAISIATEMFPEIKATIGLASGEIGDPPLSLRLTRSGPDIVDYQQYRHYMARLETEANANFDWFLVDIGTRRIEEEPSLHYRTGSE